MPDAPAAPADPAPADPASGDPAPGDPEGRPASTPQGRDRSPGWREVLLIAGAVLLGVFALEVASTLLPPVRDAFRGFPVTVVVLVAGTLGLLLVATLRRPRR